MHEVSITFNIQNNNKPILKGYEKIDRHLVFDTKIDFIKKVRQVLDSYKNSVPKGSNNVKVVLRKNIRITFTYTALNDIEVFVANLRNVYL